MDGHPTILADRVRAAQFHFIAHACRLFQGFEVHTDNAGITWAAKRVADHVFAVTWLGPGWVFDSFLANAWTEDLAIRREQLARAGAEEHVEQLQKVIDRLRLGPLAGRMLWALAQEVQSSRSSLIRRPCSWFDRRVWGPDEALWPRDHRKQVVLQVLESLSWLHVAEWVEEGWPLFGPATALLTDVMDLGGTPDDRCGDGCPGLGGSPHHHIQLNAAPGLLGDLERFAHADDKTGVRTYCSWHENLQ